MWVDIIQLENPLLLWKWQKEGLNNILFEFLSTYTKSKKDL